MAAFNPQKARQARRQVRRLRKRVRAYKRQERQSNRYDPLAPLAGKRLKQERRAAERLQFGPQAQELRRAIGNQDQTTADRATYYDDYRKALGEATARVNAANAANVKATEQRVDSSYTQDKAAVQARDAAQTVQATNLGRAPVQSQEGARAVEAQRSQGNQAAARTRDQSAADTKYLSLREANSVLAKTEDQSRMSVKRDQLRREQKDLARDRGAFRADFRRRTRQDEREWSAIQKEFGLKRRGQNLEFKQNRKDRQLERQKLNAQKAIARIYASKDRAGARAQVRVAELQLEKGKISQKQYREIVNIYKGLPGGKGDKAGGGKLQTWERDKVQKFLFDLRNHAKPTAADRADTIKRMISKGGLEPRLARIVWRRYAKSLGSNYDKGDVPG